MKIYSIELENYRQYRGKQKITLTTDDKRNVNVIIGTTGAGKTNLLNAITWCLYGKEKSLEKTEESLKLNIVNIKELSDLHKGKSTEAKVRITVGRDKPENFFERKIKILKDNENKFRGEETEFNAWFMLNGQWKESVQPEITRNSLLPEAIHNFFLFDGERLDDFFKAGNEEDVEKAINDVCHIGLLDICIEHLSGKIVEKRKSAKSTNPKTNELTEKIEIYEKSKQKLIKDNEKYAEDKKLTIKHKEEMEEKLRNSNATIIQSLQKQRDILNSDKEKTTKKLLEIQQENKEYFIKNIPSIYGIKAVNKTKKLIDDKFNKAELPPKIQEEYIKQLLKHGKCICGDDITKNHEKRKCLEKLMEQSSNVGMLYEKVKDGQYILANIIKSYEEFWNEYDTVQKKCKELEDELEKNKDELEEIYNNLKGTNIENIRTWEDIRKKCEETIGELQGNIRANERDIERHVAQIQECNKELKKELEKEKNHRELLEMIGLCEESQKVLEEIREEVIEEVREKIRKKTEEYFLNLIWKKNTYNKVVIDDKYRVGVINNMGHECIGSLSAGERQILALSFMASLTNVSGFDAPVVIDTPLGRIAGEPKENIANSLPSYLENTQLTLLATDQEYTKVVKEKLKNRLGKEYTLDYNEERYETTIKGGDKIG